MQEEAGIQTGCLVKTSYCLLIFSHILQSSPLSIPADRVKLVQLQAPVVTLECSFELAKSVIIIHPPNTPSGCIEWIYDYHLIVITLTGIDLLGKTSIIFLYNCRVLSYASTDKSNADKISIRIKIYFI